MEGGFQTEAEDQRQHSTIDERLKEIVGSVIRNLVGVYKGHVRSAVTLVLVRLHLVVGGLGL